MLQQSCNRAATEAQEAGEAATCAVAHSTVIVQVEGGAREALHPEGPGAGEGGTHFTCFTSTKVQILTLKALQAREAWLVTSSRVRLRVR